MKTMANVCVSCLRNVLQGQAMALMFAVLTMKCCLLSSVGGFPTGTSAAPLNVTQLTVTDTNPGSPTDTDNTTTASAEVTPFNVTSLPPTAPAPGDEESGEEEGEDYLDQALFIYIMAGLCVVTMVVLLCKYYVCRRTMSTVVLRKPPRVGRNTVLKEQVYKQLTDSGVILHVNTDDW